MHENARQGHCCSDSIWRGASDGTTDEPASKPVQPLGARSFLSKLVAQSCSNVMSSLHPWLTVPSLSPPLHVFADRSRSSTRPLASSCSPTSITSHLCYPSLILDAPRLSTHCLFALGIASQRIGNGHFVSPSLHRSHSVAVRIHSHRHPLTPPRNCRILTLAHLSSDSASEHAHSAHFPSCATHCHNTTLA